MEKVYVIHSFCDDDNETRLEGVFLNFNDAKKKAISLVNDYNDGGDYEVFEITDVNLLKMHGESAVYVYYTADDAETDLIYEVTVFEEKVR